MLSWSCPRCSLNYFKNLQNQNQQTNHHYPICHSAAGSAVYKVMFKKLMGEVNFHQVSLFFSVIGILNTVLLWPIVVTLYFTGAGNSWTTASQTTTFDIFWKPESIFSLHISETLDWQCLPWTELCGAAALSLVKEGGSCYRNIIHFVFSCQFACQLQHHHHL